jgi:hypothetical protein
MKLNGGVRMNKFKSSDKQPRGFFDRISAGI